MNVCPECLRFSIFNFSSKTAELIETKIQVEPLWDGGLSFCSWDLGHINKMAAMPIYGINPFEMFFSGLICPETWCTALGTQALKSSFSDDFWLTLTYFNSFTATGDNNRLLQTRIDPDDTAQ